MADLVIEGARTLTFVRSRRGAELTAMGAATTAGRGRHPSSAERVAAYRAGYLAEDRRELEAALSDGTLLGAATTNALELGVDIAGLDAVVVAGFPGTRRVVLAAGGARPAGGARGRWWCWSPATIPSTPTSSTTRRRCSTSRSRRPITDPRNPVRARPATALRGSWNCRCTDAEVRRVRRAATC